MGWIADQYRLRKGQTEVFRSDLTRGFYIEEVFETYSGVRSSLWKVVKDSHGEVLGELPRVGFEGASSRYTAEKMIDKHLGIEPAEKPMGDWCSPCGDIDEPPLQVEIGWSEPSLIDNGDGTLTYTTEDGISTTIDNRPLGGDESVLGQGLTFDDRGRLALDLDTLKVLGSGKANEPWSFSCDIRQRPLEEVQPENDPQELSTNLWYDH